MPISRRWTGQPAVSADAADHLYHHSELGARAGSRPLPVGLVVVTEYVPGAHWEPETLSPGRGLLELVPHTLSAIRAPEPAFAALQNVVARAAVFKGPRGEAPEAVAAILQSLRDRELSGMVRGGEP